MNKIKVPFLVWVAIVLSGLMVSGGYVFSLYLKATLNYEATSLRSNAIADSSQIIIMTQSLKEVIKETQLAQQKQTALILHYEELKKHNQPLIMLQPTIDELKQLQGNFSLGYLEKLAIEVDAVGETALTQIKAKTIVEN